jgi:hypothetical protein
VLSHRAESNVVPLLNADQDSSVVLFMLGLEGAGPDSQSFTARLKSRPDTKQSFSATCEARTLRPDSSAAYKAVPIGQVPGQPPLRDWTSLVYPTQHCVLGYSQTSLRD